VRATTASGGFLDQRSPRPAGVAGGATSMQIIAALFAAATGS
jgi:hypothetical protein